MTNLHYDLDLEDVFPINNNNGNPLVKNKHFNDWKERIEHNMKNRGISNYIEEDLKLIDKCKNHIAKYSKNIDNKEIIGLAHPFYLSMSHMQHLNESTFKNYKQYIKNLKELFDKRGDNKILVFETAHNYGTITSRFLEEGLVDDAIITRADWGYAHKFSDLKKYSEKSFFMGGCYSGACLGHIIRDLLKITNKKNIFAIRGMCLENPKNHISLFSEYIQDIEFKNFINLKDTLSKISFLGKVK